MNTIPNILRRLIVWLNERDAPAGDVTDLREWADRPTHHPSSAA